LNSSQLLQQSSSIPPPISPTQGRSQSPPASISSNSPTLVSLSTLSLSSTTSTSSSHFNTATAPAKMGPAIIDKKKIDVLDTPSSSVTSLLDATKFFLCLF
jgi:hypothetical protein